LSRALLAAAALLAASCATTRPADEALRKLVGTDATSYALVGVDNGIARYEKALKPGAVTRTQMAVCRSGDNGWACTGPFDAARVTTPRSVQRLAAGPDIDDAALLRVVGYLESECFERQLGSRRIADRRVSAVEYEAGQFQVALGGPYVVDVLELEPDAACGFELRRHRLLRLD